MGKPVGEPIHRTPPILFRPPPAFRNTSFPGSSVVFISGFVKSSTLSQLAPPAAQLLLGPFTKGFHLDERTVSEEIRASHSSQMPEGQGRGLSVAERN